MTPAWLHRLPDLRVPILFEDPHLLIVAKPAGLYLPGSAARSGTDFLEWLTQRDEVQISKTGFLRPVNRLAATESGLIILAKSETAFESMSRLFRLGKVRQTFWALLDGRFKPKEKKDRDADRSSKDRRSRSPARTALMESIEVWGKTDRLTLIKMQATGGPRIDLRAFFRARAAPVLGDRRGVLDTQDVYAGRCYLHLGEVAFAHPITHKNIKVQSSLPKCYDERTRGGDGLEDALANALASRLECMSKPDTTVFRLVNGSPDGVSGLLAEWLGSTVVLWTEPGKFDASNRRLARAAKFYQRVLGADVVFHKQRVKNRASAGEDESESTSQVLLGVSPGDEVIVLENGLRFLIKPEDGWGAGLFLDQRDNRLKLRKLAAGKRVLNTFAYTCGFSLSAAAGRAESTTSIDQSKRHLAWGERNFELNGLSGESHQFVAAEVFDYLARAAKHERQFDIIVIDPPTFARSKKPKRVFSLAADLPALIQAALVVLAPSGVILLNTNSRTHSPRFLRDAAKRGAGDRKFRVLSAPDLPADFATDPRHSKSLWLEFPGPVSQKRRTIISSDASSLAPLLPEEGLGVVLE